MNGVKLNDIRGKAMTSRSIWAAAPEWPGITDEFGQADHQQRREPVMREVREVARYGLHALHHACASYGSSKATIRSRSRS